MFLSVEGVYGEEFHVVLRLYKVFLRSRCKRFWNFVCVCVDSEGTEEDMRLV